MLLPLLAFVFGSLIVGTAVVALMPRRAAAIDRRLEELMPGRPEEHDAKPRLQSLVGVFKRIGEKAPHSGKETGTLRQRLVQAGYRREEALTIFYGMRVMFALGLFLFFSTSIVSRPNMTVALAGLALGYILPGMALARLAKRRSHRIRSTCSSSASRPASASIRPSRAWAANSRSRIRRWPTSFV
jgi:Flp pilus assembly protein TadB